MDRKHIVIVGGGYAGVQVAKQLKDRARVTLISDENFLTFTPMLAEVAAAEIEPRHIVAPLRELCPHAEVVIGLVDHLDLDARSVRVRSMIDDTTATISGDALVLTAGSIPADFGIEGVDQHAITFKTLGDALRIRRRLVHLLEAASGRDDATLASVAIVGAGYSGAELAAGLADFLNEVLPRYYPNAGRHRIVLVDAADCVVPTLPDRLTRAAKRALQKRGVEVILGKKVERVTRRGVDIEDGRTIDAATVIWSAGVRASPLASATGAAQGKQGRLEVDGRMRIRDGIFALGDIAAVPDGHGGVCPPTAQHALRQGRWLGKHLLGIIDGKRTGRFSYRTKGQLVSLGRRNAVGLVMGATVSGFPGWFLWRSYYLMRLPTLTRKVRVALDWTLDLFFPPDIAGIPSGDLGPLPDRE